MGEIPQNDESESRSSYTSWISETSDRQGRERGLETYQDYLGIKKEDLRGKDILDLGSGETERFSRELKAAGIDANVICVNPDYSIERFRKANSALPDWQKKSVAAIAQELPFKDECFDEVFAVYSITVFASPSKIGGNIEATKRWLSEIVRVLKPGGEARIMPLRSFPKSEEQIWQEDYGPLLEDLKKQGLDVSVELIRYKDIGHTMSSSSHMNKDGVIEEFTEYVGDKIIDARAVIKKPHEEQ